MAILSQDNNGEGVLGLKKRIYRKNFFNWRVFLELKRLIFFLIDRNEYKDKTKEGILSAKALLVETRLVYLGVKMGLNILHNTREVCILTYGLEFPCMFK